MTASLLEHLRQQGAHLQDEAAPNGSAAGEALMNAADLLENHRIKGWMRIGMSGCISYTECPIKAAQWREWKHLGSVYPVYHEELKA